jgi:hypothetical protein
MAAVLTPEYIENLDFTGAHQMAEMARKALPPQLQQQEDDDAMPPAAKQMIAQLQAELQKAQQMIATDGAKEQVKQQGAIQQEQMRGQIELQKAQLQRQTELDKATIQANATVAVAELKSGDADVERRLNMLELFLTADKEARLDAESKAHEAATQGRDHAHDHAMADQEHAQALVEASHAAAIAPEPAAPQAGA